MISDDNFVVWYLGLIVISSLPFILTRLKEILIFTPVAITYSVSCPMIVAKPSNNCVLWHSQYANKEDHGKFVSKKGSETHYQASRDL